MYLQLAEDAPTRRPYGGFQERRRNYRAAQSQTIPDDANPFIYVPDPSAQSKGVFIREDHFDFMTPFEWRQLMAQLAPFQPEVEEGTMSEGMFLNDRASRKAKREERQKGRQEKKDLKNKKKAAKNELINARAEAKKSGRGADVLGSVIDGVKGIFGRGETDTRGGDGEILSPDGGPLSPLPPEKQWYENPLVIGGGAALLLGGIYMMRKR